MALAITSPSCAVLPPLSVGEMTLRLYAALSYCLGAQLAISVHNCPVVHRQNCSAHEIKDLRSA